MSRWLRQYSAISWHALTVSLGSPFSLILHLAILVFGWLIACLPFFTFGEQVRLIRDQGLALCLLGGVLGSAIGAGLVVSDDIRSGSAAVTMSRPVGHLCYVAGKWTGLVCSIAVIQVSAGVSCLWLTKITASAEALDVLGLAIYAGAIVVSLGLVAAKHYLFGGAYVWQANGALLVCFALAFGVSLLVGGAGDVDWPTAQGSLLVCLGLVMYASLVTCFAVVFDSGVVLALGTLAFFGALLSETLLAGLSRGGWLLTAGRTLLPNLQLYWISDRLAEGVSVPWAYVVGCAIHSFGYAIGILLIGAYFFGRRELEGSQ